LLRGRSVTPDAASSDTSWQIAGRIAKATWHRAANQLSAAVDGFSRAMKSIRKRGAVALAGVLAFRSGDRARARELVERAPSALR
jgi:hypothetical protein